MLSCTALLMDRWKQAHGTTITSVAIATSLVAFTFRLALTQFHQQQEIARRVAAQNQPECSLQQATVRAEEIRKRLQEYRAQTEGQAADPLTSSIGVAAFDETTDRVDLLLKFADDALYLAKRGGRIRVVAARPAVALPDSNSTEADPATVLATETT